MANQIADSGGGLGGLAQIISAAAPLFLGNRQTQTVTGNPADIAANNAFIQTLLPKATGGVDSATYSPIVQAIMQKAAEAFAPTRAMQTSSGGYNSTTLKLLSDRAKANASGEAAQAVLQSQNEAQRTIAGLLSTNTNANRTVNTRTPPQVPTPVSLGLLALAAARSAAPKTTASVGNSIEDTIANLFKKAPTTPDTSGSVNIGGGINFGTDTPNFAFGGSGVGGTGVGGAGSFVGSGFDPLLNTGGLLSEEEIFNTIDQAARSASANSALSATATIPQGIIPADATETITQPLPFEDFTSSPLEGPAAAVGAGEGYTGGGFNPEQYGGEGAAGYKNQTYSPEPQGATTTGATATATAEGGIIGVSGAGADFATSNENNIFASLNYDDILTPSKATIDPNLVGDVDLGLGTNALSGAGSVVSGAVPYLGPAVQVATGNYESAAGGLLGSFLAGPPGAVVGSTVAPIAGDLFTGIKYGNLTPDEGGVTQATKAFADLDPTSGIVSGLHTGNYGDILPNSIVDPLSDVEDLFKGGADIISRPEQIPQAANDVLSHIGDIVGTVICTQLYRSRRISRREYIADMRWGQMHVSETTLRGYHFWAKPLVRAMQRSKFVTNICDVVFSPWARQLAGRSSVWGSFLKLAGPAICFVLGSFLEMMEATSVVGA